MVLEGLKIIIESGISTHRPWYYLYNLNSNRSNYLKIIFSILILHFINGKFLSVLFLSIELILNFCPIRMFFEVPIFWVTLNILNDNRPTEVCSQIRPHSVRRPAAATVRHGRDEQNTRAYRAFSGRRLFVGHVFCIRRTQFTSCRYSGGLHHGKCFL